MKLKKIICSSVYTLSVLQSCAAARPQANGSILNVLKVTLPIFGIVTVGGVAWALWPEKEPPKENNPKNNGESPLCNTNLLQEKEDQNETPQQTPTQPPFNLGIPAAPEPIPVIQPQNNNNNNDTTPEPVPEDSQNTQNIEPVQSAAAPTPADTQNEQTVVAPTTPLTNMQNIEPIQPAAINIPPVPLQSTQPQPKPVPKAKKITPKLQPTIVPHVQTVPSDDESAHPDINVSMPSFDFSQYAQDADDIDTLQNMLDDFRPNYEGCGLQCGDLVPAPSGEGTILKWSDYENTGAICPKDMKFKNDIALPYISSKDVTEKISKATAILNKESSLLQIDSQGKGVMIVGDLHGNIDSLRGIFVHFLNMLDNDEVSHIVFLGDFTDRRFYGIESLTLLCHMKTLMPDRVHLIRGNHEHVSMFFQSSYITALHEAKCKYPEERKNVQKTICNLYNSLPFAAVIDGTALCLHGGITEDLKEAGGLEKINDIKRTNKGFNMEDDPIASGITWSEANYKAEKPGFVFCDTRGRGYTYSPDDLKYCLENNGLKTLFSGHVHKTAKHDLGDGYSHVTLLSSGNFTGKNENCNVAVLDPDGTYYVERVNSNGGARKVNVKK